MEDEVNVGFVFSYIYTYMGEETSLFFNQRGKIRDET